MVPCSRAILPVHGQEETRLQQIAYRVVQEATRQAPTAEEPEKLSPKAAAGQKGGRKGGKARAAKLTPEERSKAARKAARVRWDSSKKE